MTTAQEYNAKFFLMVNLTLIYHNERARSVCYYAYCLNNPIKFIDPDGNKPNSARSRIQYSGNGIFNVNISSLNKATRNNYYIASQNPDNWTYDSQTGQKEIGISTKVGELQLQYHPITTDPNYNPPTMDNTAGATDPTHNPTKHNVQNPTTKTGQPDKRYAQRSVSGSAGGVATQGGAIFMLALHTFFVATDLWNAISVMQDNDAIALQTGLLNQATKIVNKRMAKIDPKYRNNNDIGAIINFVFQGVNDTDNQDITTIGTDILKLIGRYDKKTKQVKPLIQK